MLDSRYIYDINATTLPLTKELLSSCLNNNTIKSYVLCKYENLITTINSINREQEMSGTLNGRVLFDSINNPTVSFDCVIQIEGLKKTDDNYLDQVLQSNDSITWTDFKTYSPELRAEIRGMKETIFKETLWNRENVESWFISDRIEVPDALKEELINDWSAFKKMVLSSRDVYKYASACTDDSKRDYANLIYKNAANLLQRYKVEIMAHARQQNKNDDLVTIRKPVVSHIYIMSNLYSRCAKDWPSLAVSPLIKKNLETLGLYL